MRARWIALLSLIGLPGAGAASPQNADKVAVVRAVLHFYAGAIRVPHALPAGRPLCVARELGEAPFEAGLASLRRSVREEFAQSPTVAARPADQAEIDERVRNRLWLSGPHPRDAETRHIVDAAFALASSPASRPLARIEPGWLSGKERLGIADDCAETLRLSSPAIRDGYGFVEVSHHCGVLCGLGAVLLLKKQADGSWAVERGNIHLIS